MNDSRERIYRMTFSSVYPLLLRKVERKGRSKEELDLVIAWLTGYDAVGLSDQLERQTTYEEFFASAPRIHPLADQVTGTICGVRIAEIEDPLVRLVRQLDKLVDELAKGRPLEKIMRSAANG